MTRVYSVGHSNLAADAFAALLRGAGIRTLADVRRVPFSRRFPWFSRDALTASLQEAGITYRWLGDGLGGRLEPAGARDDSRNRALRSAPLRAYADAQETPAFQRDLAALLELAARAPTAVMCAERDWRQCHRQILADVLVARGTRVVHLSPIAAPEPHALAPSARIEGELVTYPSLL
ncbi:MAG TPA: DUF488 domain-containing protein [Myxococcota bacterium]|nr:DUF488 domain-containing protein [Myxococcota bacterium]